MYCNCTEIHWICNEFIAHFHCLTFMTLLTINKKLKQKVADESMLNLYPYTAGVAHTNKGIKPVFHAIMMNADSVTVSKWMFQTPTTCRLSGTVEPGSTLLTVYIHSCLPQRRLFAMPPNIKLPNVSLIVKDCSVTIMLSAFIITIWKLERMVCVHVFAYVQSESFCASNFGSISQLC